MASKSFIDEKAKIYGKSGKPLTKYQIAINDTAVNIAKENPDAIFDKGRKMHHIHATKHFYDFCCRRAHDDRSQPRAYWLVSGLLGDWPPRNSQFIPEGMCTRMKTLRFAISKVNDRKNSLYCLTGSS